MTNKEAKEVCEIYKALNHNRDALETIRRDELLLYCIIGKKPKNIGQLLSDDQYIEVEELVKSFLQQNINDCLDELDRRKLTIEMFNGKRGGDT